MYGKPICLNVRMNQKVIEKELFVQLEITEWSKKLIIDEIKVQKFVHLNFKSLSVS